jgi:hypothetical protein
MRDFLGRDVTGDDLGLDFEHVAQQLLDGTIRFTAFRRREDADFQPVTQRSDDFRPSRTRDNLQPDLDPIFRGASDPRC